MIHDRLIKNKSGFTLIEALLTTIVVAGIFIVIFNILSDYAENILARSTSNYMNGLSLAVEEIIEVPDNFQNIYAAANANPNDILELTTSDLVNGFTANGVLISPSASVNSSLRNSSPLRTGINIMVKIGDNPAISTDAQALEIILAADARIRDSRVRKAAEDSKIYGGFYREVGEAKSAFASWRFDPIAYLNGTAWQGIASANPPSADDGSYLIHYKYVDFENIAGDYLYRVGVSGRPDLNQIYTNLNMGGNDILGADNMNVADNIDVNSKVISKGTSSMANAVFSNGNFVANRTLQTSTAIVSGVGGGVTGNFSVQGTLDSQSIMRLSQDISANDATLSGGLNASTSLSVENMDNVNNITTNDMFVTNLDLDSDTDVLVGNQLSTQAATIQNMTITQGDFGTVDAQINDSMTVNGQIISPRIVLDTLDVDEFGACDNDCLAF